MQRLRPAAPLRMRPDLMHHLRRASDELRQSHVVALDDCVHHITKDMWHLQGFCHRVYLSFAEVENIPIVIFYVSFVSFAFYRG
jgi:hypothetical protein